MEAQSARCECRGEKESNCLVTPTLSSVIWPTARLIMELLTCNAAFKLF